MLWAAGGLPSLRVIFWILVALVGARNGANALNRLIDKDIDAMNPRTSNRHLPRGIIKDYEVIGIVVLCFALLTLAAYELNYLCLELLPLALAIFIVYSYTKRFTWLCHIILGIACGGAPVGAWMAVKGEIGWPSLVLGAVVALWIAGFDIIYGTQDVEFDRNHGIYSIPARFGIENALKISTGFHLAAMALLVYLYFLMNMGWLYLVGLAIDAYLLYLEHSIVSPTNLRNVRIASYDINEVVSVVLLIFTTADIFLLQ
jgi:putative 4-hydroxybenzoate polyprenyltransferase